MRIVTIPKSATKVRTLALQRFTDRVVAKALLNCLTAFWQRRSVTRSVWQVYAQLDREIRRRRAYFLAIDDIKDCFPSAPLDEVMRCHWRGASLASGFKALAVLSCRQWYTRTATRRLRHAPALTIGWASDSLHRTTSRLVTSDAF